MSYKRISELYQVWGKWQNEIFSVYQDKLSPLPPLSEQKQFKSLKNMVIQEALKIAVHGITFEDEFQSKEHAEEDIESDEQSDSDMGEAELFEQELFELYGERER